jgi:hypothetical protein
MKRTLALLLTFLIGTSLDAQNLQTRDETSRLAFIKRGRLFTQYFVPPGNPFEDLITTHYNDGSGRIVIITGSLEGLQEMVRNELPGGIDQSFVEDTLVKLLAVCLSADSSDVPVLEKSFKMLEAQVKEGTFDKHDLDLLTPPRTSVAKNDWKVLFMCDNREGTFTAKIYEGKLAPFQIISGSVLTIRDRAMIDSDRTESKRRIREAFSLFEREP